MHGIEKALRDGRVRIDAAVAQKGPVAARVFNQAEVDLADQNLLCVMRGLGDDAAKRIGQKAAAPELEARPGGAIAANVAMLVADAVHAGHVDAVGDGVGALDGLPRVVLRCAKLVFLCRVPADGGGIEQNFGALQGGEPRAFGIPLIPADQRAYAAKCRIDSA